MREHSRFLQGRSRIGFVAGAIGLVAVLVAGCSAVNPGSASVSSSSNAAGATAAWTYSATAGGSGLCGMTVTVNGPPGTVFPGDPSAYVMTDVTQSAKTSPSSVAVGAGDATFDIDGSFISAVDSGDAMTVVVNGVKDPAVGSYPASDFTTVLSTCFLESPQTVTPASGLDFVRPIPPLAFTGVTSAAWPGQPIVTYAHPSGQVGQLFFDVLHSDGGFQPYTWTLSGGTLPPGLSLYPSGAILGKPTEAGTYTFTARVTDLAMHHIDIDVTITITQ